MILNKAVIRLIKRQDYDNPIITGKIQLPCEKRENIGATDDGIIVLSSVSHGEEYFPEDSFDRICDLEEKHFWHRVRKKIVHDMLSKHVKRGSRVLDVGCGTGNVASYLKKKGWDVDCGDSYLKGLLCCRKRCGEGKYFQFDLCDPVFDSEYDCITALDVIEHIDDDALVLSNLYKALKKDGVLIVTVPAYDFMWSGRDDYAGHKRRYTINELDDKLEKAGFHVVKKSYYMTFLFPALLTYRLFSRYFSGDSANKLTSEVKINPLLNQLFYIIFSAESILVRSFYLPFGNSIICIAKK